MKMLKGIVDGYRLGHPFGKETQEMDRERFVELIGKMQQGSASERELQELDTLYETFEHKPGLMAQIAPHERPEQAELLFQKIHKQVEPVHVRPNGRSYHIVWISIAASICLFTFWWGYTLVFQNHHPEDQVQMVHHLEDAFPAEDKAYLTLADGRSVTLDQRNPDELKNLHFSMNAEGALVYQAPDDPSGSLSNNYHTITTPKGGRYQVVLPDGTRVWINAGSSLVFPVVFDKDIRHVRMRGEAYFDVATVVGKQGRIPFVVETSHQQIEVLGTEFNVAAYTRQPSEITTLVEGSVRVKGNSIGQEALLRPGQSALIEAGKVDIRTANIEKETAWKNGMFRFENDNIRTVMQQLENWYDVEIDYGHMPTVHFNGGISRSLPLSKVLAMLEVAGGFRFEIHGKHVKISANK